MSNAYKIVDIESNKPKKLLIIDDDKDLIKLLDLSLSSEFNVRILDNASDALVKIEEFTPDAILLDLNMPHIDGYEFLKILNQHPSFCDIPVIAMTASKSSDHREKAYDAGANGIIHKPFNVINLARDIEGILKSTENILMSKNKRVNYIIEFSENKKNKKIKSLIAEHDFEKESLVILSWYRGEDFFEDNPEVLELIDEEKLFFLEIKPSLISKFPYLQNLSPVTTEIDQFLAGNTRNYHLIFEEPRNLLNIHQQEKSIFQAYNMAQMLHSHFSRITYINSKPTTDEATKFLTKIGKILTGIQN